MIDKYLLRYVLVVTILAGLLCGGIARAGAAQTPAANDKAEQLKAAQATIEQAKSKKQAEALKALEKEMTPLERQWGIKILWVRRTAAGLMLHFKMKVVDPEKAYRLLDHDTKSYVIVEKSGAVVKVPFMPKVGSLRASVRSANMVKKNRNYATLFANPGGYIKLGDKVTVVIGNFMAEHLTVQ